MTDDIEADRNLITTRNRLRGEAGLPLLSEEAELKRLQAIREEVAFEQYFAEHRHRFAHLWQGRGWLTGMGMVAVARRKLREEMRQSIA